MAVGADALGTVAAHPFVEKASSLIRCFLNSLSWEVTLGFFLLSRL
jgi:hypothetical protein